MAGTPVSTKDGREFALAVGHSTAANTVKLLGVLAAKPGFFADAKRGIAFADAFVEVSAKGLVVHKPSPDHRARFGYAFPYPKATAASLYEKFMQEIFRGDGDAAPKVAALEEFAGAALTGVAPAYERAVILVGGGSNGKSRFAKILKSIMPPGTVTALPPQLFADQYALPQLINSTLNVVGELPKKAIDGSEEVKAVISGDGVHSRVPGREPVSFTPKAAHMFLVNPQPGKKPLPPVSDRSPAFWRRWIMIEFNRNFELEPGIRDPFIADKIIAAELPQIVARALEGAARLLKTPAPHYSLPESHDRWIAIWRGDADPVAAFFEKRTVKDEKGTPATKLFDEFKRWAASSGIDQTSETAFGTSAKRVASWKRRSGGVVYFVRVVEAEPIH